MENQLTVKQWIVTILLLSIPIVNIILLIVWAFGNKNLKTNYSRAALIVGSSYFVVLIILAGLVALFSTINGGFSTDDYEEVGMYVSDYVDEDIEILSIALEPNEEDNDFGLFVSGEIKNNSIERDHTNVSLVVNFYNDQEQIVGTDYIRIDDIIPSGEIYSFREYISVVNVDRINEAKSIKIHDIY